MILPNGKNNIAKFKKTAKTIEFPLAWPRWFA
jgi:hypothetical protein